MTERIRLEVDDAELDAAISKMDEALAKRGELLGIGVSREAEDLTGVGVAVEDEVQATVDRLIGELEFVEDMSAIVDASVQETVDRLTVEILATGSSVDDLKSKFLDIDLPGVDRATRMILLRIPGLRDALQLLYRIRMMQRTLKLGALRGPVTAGIIAAIYAYMALQWLEQRQDRLEARMEALERGSSRRFITIEEAVRGYGMLPERYRSTVIT